ncbi:MAG: HAD family hydrolase [Prevotella sp.]|nr:HAD family hydrolase [Prevotella sp.]
MIQGYIFDYGGTLDTGGNHWGKVLWHSYERQQLPVSEQQFREAYVYGERTLGRNPIIQPDFTFHKTLETKLRLQADYLLSNYGIDLGKSLPSVLDDVYSQTQHHTAHSIGVLRQLRDKGLPMVLVSNFYGNVEVVLRELGFDGLFEDVVESAVVGIRKPDHRIFTLGVQALGLQPEEVVVVGDSIDKDILPAHKAGCHTIWYEGEPWTDDPVDRSIPDRIITDLTQLL